jgi:CPA2 family monovalent cation:H+ antiporter-2
MLFMTEGLGLSNTSGTFLAGVLLSKTKYRYQVEADIAPFRGILLGLFFVTAGFEIDMNLIASNLPLVSSIVFGIMSHHHDSLEFGIWFESFGFSTNKWDRTQYW